MRTYALQACVVLAALAVLLSSVPVASAATLNVPSQYAKIQTAIGAANTGDTVVVATGTYHERIDFGGKAITVQSSAPANAATVAATIINGDAGGSVVTFSHSETSGAMLTGFTITNGHATSGGGLYIQGASPTIDHPARHGVGYPGPSRSEEQLLEAPEGQAQPDRSARHGVGGRCRRHALRGQPPPAGRLQAVSGGGAAQFGRGSINQLSSAATGINSPTASTAPGKA